jgi:hypothetical protein
MELALSPFAMRALAFDFLLQLFALARVRLLSKRKALMKRFHRLSASAASLRALPPFPLLRPHFNSPTRRWFQRLVLMKCALLSCALFSAAHKQ